MIGFRMKMIVVGYEDGNDVAVDAVPAGEPARRAGAGRDGGGPWSIFTAASFRQIPKRIALDIDDTFDAVHGRQQLRLFNAHHDEYGL